MNEATSYVELAEIWSREADYQRSYGDRERSLELYALVMTLPDLEKAGPHFEAALKY